MTVHSIKNAVVIGGGPAGLTAALAISKRPEVTEVTVVDSDNLSGGPTPRNGAPQGYHAHVLLGRGYEEMVRHAPNLQSRLLSQGATNIDFNNDTRVLLQNGWVAVTKSGINTIVATRPLIEWAIRQEAKDNPKIRLLGSSEVHGIIQEGKSVRGIAIKSFGNQAQDLMCDLVVDASGRRSMASKWLSDGGFGEPEVEEIHLGVNYATRMYSIDKLKGKAWKVLAMNTIPPDMPRMGYLARVEGGKYIVSLGGVGKEAPPVDNEGFLKFARNLAHPAIYDAIKDAVPESGIHSFRFPGSRLYRYEKMADWPQNFVVVGDAYASSNPFYGQGMTMGALHASAIDSTLKRHNNGNSFSRTAQAEIAKATRFSWTLATGEDNRWLQVATPWMTKMVQGYINRILDTCPFSVGATVGFCKVLHMDANPSLLFTPKVVVPVVINSILRRKPSNIMPN
ncbi:MAG: FAD-dependent monooxygenase [Candidatus Micrarchaeota archaeon]|nr:FAD-dependent monooxygenase [Candidatus Micrarchaeota archaeon]